MLATKSHESSKCNVDSSPEKVKCKSESGQYSDINPLWHKFATHTPSPTGMPLLQPKLSVGSPDDKYEQEADQVADQVMRMSEPTKEEAPGIQRKIKPMTMQRVCAGCEEELQRDAIQKEEPKTLQMKGETGTSHMALQVSDSTANQIQSLRGGGKPLSSETRSFFEPRFGQDFNQVRVHTDSRAAKVAHSIQAKAFTTEQDVVFGAGSYAPETPNGKKLLAHELTHVVQQAQSHQPRIQRQELPELPEQIVPGSTQLSRVAQDYRIKHPKLSKHRNLVIVRYSIGKSKKTRVKIFKNMVEGAGHSEFIMDQYFIDREKKGTKIKVHDVYSERQPCGPSAKFDCEGMMLRNRRYKKAKVTYGYQYQAPYGKLRKKEAASRIDASSRRLRQKGQLEWDFPIKKVPPHHERMSSNMKLPTSRIRSRASTRGFTTKGAKATIVTLVMAYFASWVEHKTNSDRLSSVISKNAPKVLQGAIESGQIPSSLVASLPAYVDQSGQGFVTIHALLEAEYYTETIIAGEDTTTTVPIVDKFRVTGFSHKPKEFSDESILETERTQFGVYEDRSRIRFSVPIEYELSKGTMQGRAVRKERKKAAKEFKTSAGNQSPQSSSIQNIPTFVNMAVEDAKTISPTPDNSAQCLKMKDRLYLLVGQIETLLASEVQFNRAQKKYFGYMKGLLLRQIGRLSPDKY